MEIRDKIKQAGLKETPQRRLVYEAMLELCHASIEEIIERVQRTHPEITLSTIYRILASFEENNLLSKINHPNGKTYYDINTSEHHHIVTHEELLIDIDDPQLTEMIRQRVSEKIDSKEQIEKITVQVITTIKSK